MSNYAPQQDVATFMNMCGQEVKTKPQLPSSEILLLRAKLLFEEVSEFIEAAGCFIGLDENGEFTIFLNEKARPNLVELYDALGDINYVSYGAGCALGLNLVAGHNEIHRSNMSKANADGSITKNEFGKVIKASTYSPADLKSIIEQETNEQV